MTSALRRFLHPILYRFSINNDRDNILNFSTKSYSREGEDMMLRRIFEEQVYGFYVDVGAHHPRRFSNTCHFYKKGWHGINIDCDPDSMVAFNMWRAGDINLEYAISDRVEDIKFYKYEELVVNSLVSDFSGTNSLQDERLETLEMTTVTLESVLDEYLPDQTVIDFLTINVDGMELKVLYSNNWNRYRPKLVLVEDVQCYLDCTADSLIIRFMKSVDYVLFAKTIHTFIFRERYFKPYCS
jgi:FkbM family methyltransferase